MKEYKNEDENNILHRKLVDFTTIQEEIGALGRYQILMVLVVYLTAIPAGINMVASVFLEATPETWCALPPLDNHPELYPNLTTEELKNYTIPFNNKINAYEECERYNYTLSGCDPGKLNCISPYPPKPPLVVTISCDNGHRYNNETFKNTVTTEWNLVCSRSILKAIADSVFFLGILVGAVLGGHLTDEFGRVPALGISQLGVVAFGVGCSFSPSLSVYILIRFFLAIFVQVGYMACFVYVVEITGDRWRTLVGINVQTMFTVGECILSVCASAWRDWRDLQLYISLIPLLFCCLVVFVPESPRWLCSKGRYEKAKRISEKFAKLNGRVLSQDVWSRAEEVVEEIRTVDDVSQTRHTFVDLFKLPQMRLITLTLIFLWLVASLVYYGLALNVGNLSGNIFVVNVLNALVEPAGYVIIVLTMDRVGRRPLTVLCFFICGICCLVSTFTKTFANPNPGLGKFNTAISIIGKMFAAGAFSILANYTAELYPTVLRSTGVGMGIMGARIGGAITPFTLFLQEDVAWLTGTIFGISSITAAVATFLLPETLNQPMLTHLGEAEEFYHRKKVRSIRNDYNEIDSNE